MSPALAATLVAGTTLLLSLLLPFAVRPLLVRLGIMDVPNERSSHSRPVLRGLGLAVLIAMLVGGLLGVVLLRGGRSFGDRWDLLLVIVLASLAAGILGLGEDLHGVSVRARSIWLILIALAGPGVLLLLASRPPLPGASFGWVNGSAAVPLQLEWWSAILLLLYAMLFVSGYINVANFVDGLNGISGLHGVIAGLAFAAAGWMTGLGWLVLAGLVLAAGFAGFLPWNLTKPGAFLGDVGSYLLGG
ncbi:UDP-phosphate alpha-N-acetyl-D-fucosaminephosphotransferase, partial [Leucobacter sp. OLES1]